jgi:hypothetical protein
MSRELHDNAEKQRLIPAGVQGDAARLSQNTQTLFTPLSCIRAASELPHALAAAYVTYNHSALLAITAGDWHEVQTSISEICERLPWKADLQSIQTW